MSAVRRTLSSLLLSLIVLTAAAADDSASPDTEIWRKVRADLFGDRPIVDDGSQRKHCAGDARTCRGRVGGAA